MQPAKHPRRSVHPPHSGPTREFALFVIYDRTIYIRVGGDWNYCYRAIEREGTLGDSLLSEHRDMEATKRFFTAALEVAEQAPEKVPTDGHDAYPRARR